MPEKKFNVGNFILGLVIGAVVVGIIWVATKPAATGAQGVFNCQPISESFTGGCQCTFSKGPGGVLQAFDIPGVPAEVCANIGNPEQL